MSERWTDRGVSGFSVSVNRHDDLNSAEEEARQVANGGWPDLQHLDGVWIEDAGGDVVWLVGKPPFKAAAPQHPSGTGESQ